MTLLSWGSKVPPDVEYLPGDVPAVGFRVFILTKHDDSFKLSSLAQHYTWEAGEQVAKCLNGLTHQCPAPRCDCGIYAYHWLNSAKQLAAPYPSGGGNYFIASQDPMAAVVAAIVGYGRTMVHDVGFRTEKAQIIALGYNESSPMMLLSASDHYKINLVPMDELVEYASRHGRCYGNPELAEVLAPAGGVALPIPSGVPVPSVVTTWTTPPNVSRLNQWYPNGSTPSYTTTTTTYSNSPSHSRTNLTITCCPQCGGSLGRDDYGLVCLRCGRNV